LYGTTAYGGTTNGNCVVGCGTVFEISTSGGERVLHRFQGGADGATPAAGVIAAGGLLFGTTSGGGTGSACSGGCGTVFKLSLDGAKEETLYSFKGGRDGAEPVADLIAVNGFLYGTTRYGGAHTRQCFLGCGTVFRLTRDGKTENIIYRFTGGADGAEPAAGLTVVNGELYGTTEYGGGATGLCSTGCGTVFKLARDGTEKIVHRFNHSRHSGDGAYPAAGLIAMSGSLFGTTLAGGAAGKGTVFKTRTSGAERVIHSFPCCATSADGEYPVANLTVRNGTLYGTTRSGGAHGGGVVFEITSGSESVLSSFDKPGGIGPEAGLIVTDAALFGTTAAGGETNEGTVFKDRL
jgi:uncharacterized repeat protein (TIGR03803 family)